MTTNPTDLPFEVKFGKVVGNFVIAAADGSDADSYPDPMYAPASITFTPSIDRAATNTTFILPNVITATVSGEDGVLRDSQGNVGVWLVATENPAINPTSWTWKVTIQVQGRTAPITFPFKLEPDTEINLAQVTPIPASGGTFITRGDKGDSAYEIAVQNGYVGSESDWVAAVAVAPQQAQDAAARAAVSEGNAKTSETNAADSAAQAASKVATINREQANGVAGLNPSGLIYITRIPDLSGTYATRERESMARTHEGNKVSLLGASIVANNGDSTLQQNPVGGVNAHGPSVLGIFRWAQMVMGFPFKVLTNVSHGGDTSATILANTSSALAPGPDWVIGHDWWINDIVTGVSAATSQANIDAIIQKCNAAGATAVLTDYLPVAAYTTTAMVAQHHAMMDWLRNRQGRGFILVPVADSVLDINTGTLLTWATYDGTHPTARGAHAMGDALADGIASYIHGPNSRHPGAQSAYAANVFGNPKELVSNPMITGTPGAGFATGYSALGTAAPAASIVTATDRPLQWQRVTLGANGYANIFVGLLTGSGLSYTGPKGTITLTPGTTKTRFQFEFRMPSVSTPGKWASVEGRIYYTGAPDNAYALQENNVNGQDVGFVPDDNLIFSAHSPEYVLPAGATALNGLITIYGQAGAVIDFRRVSLAVTN